MIRQLIDVSGEGERYWSVMLGITQRELKKVIEGERITADFAISLEVAFDVPAEVWLQAQTDYHLYVARARRGISSPLG